MRSEPLGVAVTIALARLVAVMAVAVLAASCSGPDGISAAVEAEQLAELTSVDELAGAFNADAGSPRLLLLLSPT